MASIADMVAGDAIQSAGQTVDIGGAMDKGAQLAQTVQSIQAKRLEMEQSKQQLELAKYGKVAQLYEVGNQMPEGPARTSYLNKFVPNAIQGLGMGDKIHPVVQDMLTKDPAAAGYMQQQVQSGMMSPGQAAQALSDPEHFSSVYTKSNIDQYKGQQATAAMPTDLPPTPPSYQGTDKQIMAAKGQVASLLDQGRITMTDIYGAQSDPEKMQGLLQRTGLDQMGGEAALNDVLQTYPKTLAEAEKVGIGHKDALIMAGMRTAPYADRIAMQFHQQAIEDINKPGSVVSKKLGAYQSIENALKAFDASGGMPQEWEQLQTQLRINQGATGGRTGVNERADAHAKDLGISIQQYKQIATGNIGDVRQSSPQLVHAIHEVAAIELSQIRDQGLQEMGKQASGRLPVYKKKYPELMDAYQSNLDAVRGQFMEGATFNVRGRDLTPEQIKALPPDAQQFLDPSVKRQLGIK